ncbi:hypothetical protein C2I17_10675 [Niallia circulans]|uniref:hypothetical protein n=1 Tax=Niallia circulans TaxID=1397 RepID=UPI00201D6556|nr:hypothetical protein [Niallia circulans]UQZ74984.1 hypothetical protein C2I17_10675 [Niallia circulans]
MERESANLRKYQPKWRGNQPTSENISQSGEGISQTLIYQPKWRGNQPNSDISAKVERESANLRKYQPK